MLILDPSLMYAAVAFASLINEAYKKYKAGELSAEIMDAQTPEELEPLWQGMTMGELKDYWKANRKTCSPVRTAQQDSSNRCGRIYLGAQNNDEEQEERALPIQASSTTSYGSTEQERSTRSSNRRQPVQEIELSDMRPRQPVRRNNREAHTPEELEPLQGGLTLGDFESPRAGNRRQQGTFSSIKNVMFGSAESIMQKVRSAVDPGQHRSRHGGRIYIGVRDSDEELSASGFYSQKSTHSNASDVSMSQTEAAHVRSDRPYQYRDNIEFEDKGTYLTDIRVTSVASNCREHGGPNARRGERAISATTSVDRQKSLTL